MRRLAPIFGLLLATTPVVAQETPEQQVERLQKENTELRFQLDKARRLIEQQYDLLLTVRDKVEELRVNQEALNKQQRFEKSKRFWDDFSNRVAMPLTGAIDGNSARVMMYRNPQAAQQLMLQDRDHEFWKKQINDARQQDLLRSRYRFQPDGFGGYYIYGGN
jgi:hypothetical protein